MGPRACVRTMAWALAVLAAAWPIAPAHARTPCPRQACGLVPVGPAAYRPFYPPSPTQQVVVVPAFRLQARPVTNGEFLAFVRKHPEWRRDRVPRLFADPGYLRHWAGPLQHGPHVRAGQPVTQVSWWAARAYCKDKGLRLPTEHEWELAAQASEALPDGTRDEAWKQRILDWYARPVRGALPDVGQRPPNFWGLSDLHGLVWEWVVDFNSTLVAADDREAGNKDKLQFCGAGALAARDKGDYASFMRIAFRSSLRAHYTASALGFRCAADAQEVKR